MHELSTAPLNIVVMVNAIGGLAVLWQQRVPNVITLPYLAAGLAFHFVTDGFTGLGLSLAAVLLGVAILAVPCLLGSLSP